MQITKRADLDIGRICNQRCVFCYHKNSLNKKSGPSIEQLRRRSAILRNKGIETVDITGGEPTVRSDLTSIIRMLKEEFNIRNICLISNGYNLADRHYMKEVVEAGVNEILFSIHGPCANVHDKLVGAEGSFDRAIKALDEAGRLNLKIRVNSTITAHNYDKAFDTADMLSRYHIKNYNLIMYNPILDAEGEAATNIVRYSVAAPFLKKTIDEFGSCFDYLHVKYIPFCFMQGYEKHVMNLLQSSYIPFEWDFCLRARIRRGEVPYWLAVAAGLFLFMGPADTFGRSLEEVTHDAFIRLQEASNKHKPRECGCCRYAAICSGVWREYYRLFKAGELIPARGDKVSMPYHFVGEVVL